MRSGTDTLRDRFRYQSPDHCGFGSQPLGARHAPETPLAVDPVARTVKRADLMHNLDETRFEGCGQPDETVLSQRRERYRAALEVLDEAE